MAFKILTAHRILILCVLPGILQMIASARTDAPGFETRAEFLVITDHDTGEVLFEKNAHVPMVPASMTKIMTATIVFDRIRRGLLSLDDEFRVSPDAWIRGGAQSGSSTMFLKPDSFVSVRELLYGVIVQSGNDACIVLAEGIAGNEVAFALMMNEKAEELGLESAYFKNATGWPAEEHVISAHDLVKLASYTIDTFPKLYKIYAEKSYTWNEITQPNRNPLLLAGFPGVDGLKTGYTSVSKYGFVGSVVKNGKRRIFVLNGLETQSARRAESIRVARSAFGEFKSYKIFSEGDKAGAAKVFMGKAETVPLMVRDDVYYGLHKSLRGQLSAQIRYQSPIPAPIREGEKIAELIISAPGKAVKTVPLYAGADIDRKSLFGRAWASLVRKIRGEF